MTTAKAVQVSGDGGSTWHTLPGGSGEFNDEGEQITDTIFGQSFQSTQPGLITWISNANALYKGFAGYVASLKRSGTSTEMVAEPTTLVSGLTYQITDTAKRVIDWTKAVVVDDDGTPVDSEDIESIDHMFGKVTFVDGYSVQGDITFDAFYLPLSTVQKASSFTLTQTAETIDDTDFEVAQGNDGYRTFDPGLRTVSLELGGFYEASSAFWEELEGRENLVIEINPDGSGLSAARGIFKLVSRGQSGDVGALEEETRTFNLSVPTDVDVVFSWEHDENTTLHESIRILLTAFLNETRPMVRYLPEGLDEVGFSGTAVLTDVSLSSGLDAMNEFAANFQGSDKPTRGTISS